MYLIIFVLALMFLAGFMDPDKVKSPAENKAMTASLYLVGVVLFAPNRFGAWCRRAMRGLKRA